MGEETEKKDGVLNIPNDNRIPPTIDIMLITPVRHRRKAMVYLKGYIPPRW